MKLCTRCGNELPDTAIYCVRCGAQLDVPITGEGAPFMSVGLPAQQGVPTMPPTSGLAIASLVLGILGFFCGITAPIGLILGIVALSQIKSSEGRIQGSGLAIAGIAVSAAVTILILISIPIMAASFRLAVGTASKLPAQAALLTELNNATTLYRNDVGSWPAKLSDVALPAGTGPAGYQGPYLAPMNTGPCAPLPCDPVTGKPFDYDPATGAVTAGTTGVSPSGPPGFLPSPGHIIREAQQRAEEHAKQATQEALLMEFNNATILYRSDVGSWPTKLSDIALPAGTGPAGYHGPYTAPHRGGACDPLPCDPVTGKPFVYEPATGEVRAPE